MTQLPHNPLIWVEDLPEDVKNETEAMYVISNRIYPPGTWKLICLGNQATEEEAREIVEYVNSVVRGYRDYQYPAFLYHTALQSLASLITANGWKNPVFLWKEK